MKAIITLSIICLLGVFTSCNGQTAANISIPDTTKQMNLMDEQVKVFNSVFSLGGATEENPLMGATNYLELLERMDMPVEPKKQLQDIYQLYDTSLDPEKKEELKIKANKMINEAMEKSVSE